MTTNRINLLSTPRNVSTAFMYSFAQRKDVVALDEPFYASWLVATGVVHPGQEEILNSQEQNPVLVAEQLTTKDWGKPILFVKNMCPQLVGLKWDFLTAFQNIIFIRDPAQAIISFAKVFDPDAQEMGILTQLEIFNFLKIRGKTPLVLDSAELLKNPEKVLAKLCCKLEISFDKSMLQWEAGPKSVDGVWAKYWYKNAHKSTEFRITSSKASKVKQKVPHHLIPLYDQLQPAYEELAKYTITAD